jgi:hypothetical protein
MGNQNLGNGRTNGILVIVLLETEALLQCSTGFFLDGDGIRCVNGVIPPDTKKEGR